MQHDTTDRDAARTLWGRADTYTATQYTTADIDRAADRFRADEAKLLRPDGTRRYSDEEHAERVAALLADFDTTANAARDHAEAAIAEAERTLHTLEHSDPVDRLTADELARANAKALFVREDAEMLPLPELTERCRVAAASGDRVAQLLYGRYATRRARTMQAAAHERGGRLPDSDLAALRDLDSVLREMNTALADPQAKAKRAKAEAARAAAQSLRFHVTHTRGEVDGSTAAAMEQMRAMYRL